MDRRWETNNSRHWYMSKYLSLMHHSTIFHISAPQNCVDVERNSWNSSSSTHISEWDRLEMIELQTWMLDGYLNRLQVWIFDVILWTSFNRLEIGTSCCVSAQRCLRCVMTHPCSPAVRTTQTRSLSWKVQPSRRDLGHAHSTLPTATGWHLEWKKFEANKKHQ